MNKKQRMYEEIEKHGANLNAIFKTKLDNIALCKALFRLEHKASQLALSYCNGENGVDSENWEALTDQILVKVDKIIGFKAKNIPVFVNGDARGYALKIESDYTRELNIHKDWGGYGIIAPDFR
jgi:hypothetical protein